MTQHVLVVEDEEAIRDLLKLTLELAGFKVYLAEHTQQALQLLAEKIPDIILLDWMLPGMSGIDFIHRLKKDKITHHIPIILVTAKAKEDNKILGLESGADDYITKPFSTKELIVRIKTILRRGLLATPESIIQFGNLKINLEKHQAYVNEKILDLSPLEYRLLAFFMRHHGKTYNREQLISLIWGSGNDITDRTVDVTIRRLRLTLTANGIEDCIKTIRGMGYQFILEY